tara:strand:+ start:2142 stop:3581 length:1440 start_codon:yes stop_codon:yes gene_type:complete
MSEPKIKLVDEQTLPEKSVKVRITDAVSLNILKQIPETKHDEFLSKAINIGIIALNSANKQAEALQLEDIEKNLKKYLEGYQKKLSEDVATVIDSYFDENDGSFEKRIQRLISGQDGGEIGRLLEKKFRGPESPLEKSLGTFLGPESQFIKNLDPENSAGVVQAIKKTLEKVIEDQNQDILQEFDLNNKEGSLTKLLQEVNENTTNTTTDVKNIFNLNDENSELSKFKQTIREDFKDLKGTQETFLRNIVEEITKITSKKETENKTTIQGQDFEDAVFEFANRNFSSELMVEQVGTTLGTLRRRVGDIKLTLGPDSVGAGKNIIIEAKSDKSYSLSNARKELSEAKRNRDSEIGIFVFHKERVPEDISTLKRDGSDIYVVWDHESNELDAYLDAAIQLAKGLITQEVIQMTGSENEISNIKNAIEGLLRAIEKLDEMTKSVGLIDKHVNDIKDNISNIRTLVNDQNRKLKDCLLTLEKK